MAIEFNKLESLLKNAFPDSEIDLVDLIDDGDHYQVNIKSEIFAGKSKLSQHRMVNNALKEQLGGELHALSIKTSVA